jgi:riboflavin kinase/FMN adenylyltransferase
MKTARHPSELKNAGYPIVLAAGYFDGLHIGHASVIRNAVTAAAELRGRAWCLTLDTHPLRVLNSAGAPVLMTSKLHKLALMERMGLYGCIFLPFTRRLAQMRPEDFARMLMDSIPRLAGISVGSGWRFGRNASGNVALLRSVAAERGVKVMAIKPVVRRGRPVSSTIIRELIRTGRLSTAASLLGRHVSVLGIVRKGRAMGRRLGFPTANMDPGEELIPPSGVYAVAARVGSRLRGGVMNIGTRPTFGAGGSTVMEIHLLGFKGNLYGRMVEVFFARKLRPERAFPDTSSLREQIEADTRRARSVLAGTRIKEALYTRPVDVYIPPPTERKEEGKTK